MFAFIFFFCSELREAKRGCSGDRWKGNVRIRIKQRRKQRAGRKEKGGGGGGGEKKTVTEIRFTLVAGLRDDFPYQQARGSGQI